MVHVSGNFVKLAQSSTRQVETQAVIYYYKKTTETWGWLTTYTENNGIISWDITGGQQTGAFTIGKTICKSLEMTMLKNTIVQSDSKIIIKVRFVNPFDSSDASEWLTLGSFYVDTISISESSQTKKIVAADSMLKLEKSYRSSMSYPVLMKDVLKEISILARFSVDDKVDYVNNPVIISFPYAGQSNSGLRILYTRRQIVGFIASLLGANAYFTRDDKLSFTNYSKNTIQIVAHKCFKMSSSDYDYDIEDVIWAEKGESSASDDEDSYKKLYFENPLDVGLKKWALTEKLKSLLVGKNLRQISIEKQGTGLYEIGETVTVQDVTGIGIFDIVVCGIKYSMSNNGFRETIFSVASSESESNYGETSSVGSDTKGRSSALLYQINDTSVSLTGVYKEIFNMKFSSETKAAAAAAVTLSLEVGSSGNITVGFFVDTELYEEFTNLTGSGKKTISIIYPLVGLPNGGHTLSVRVKGEATAFFPVMHSYLTLIANGVSGEGGFNGTLQIKEKVKSIVISKDNEFTIGKFNAGLDTKLLTPVGSTIQTNVNGVVMKEDDVFTIGAFLDLCGGDRRRFIDSQYRTFMTRDLKRLITKTFNF